MTTGVVSTVVYNIYTNNRNLSYGQFIDVNGNIATPSNAFAMVLGLRYNDKLNTYKVEFLKCEGIVGVRVRGDLATIQKGDELTVDTESGYLKKYIPSEDGTCFVLGVALEDAPSFLFINVALRHELRQVSLPLSINHNDLSNIQGGISGEYYHFNAHEYSVIKSASINMVEAHEDISEYKAVTYTGLIANTNDASASNIRGISITSNISGYPIQIQCSGSLVNTGWTWIAGQPIFLNGTSLSQTAPSTGILIQLGTAVSNQEMDIRIEYIATLS